MGEVISISDTNVEIDDRVISPRHEQAIRMYATGQATVGECARACGVGETYLHLLIHTPAGQKIIRCIQQELDFRYQSLYSKFIDVVEQALQHPDPSVALAGANLFAKTRIGTKVNVDLSAEDIVQQIMSGTYSKE